MARQEAATVVAAPLSDIESRLRDVEQWPAFLIGLREVARSGPGRYRFTLDDGSRPRDVDMAVTPHPGEHRIVWRSLRGPACRGEWRLVPVDEGHTRVRLTIATDPATFAQGLAEMLSPSKDTAACDLQRLEAYLLGDRGPVA